MNIEEAVNYGTLKLRRVPSPQKESEILLSELLNRDRLYLILNREEILESKTKNSYLGLLNRRAGGEPLEYLTNRVSFYSSSFHIAEGALIPRPESELLIDEVLKLAKNGDSILEIGVGSGVLSITLAEKLKESQIVGVDISEKALKVANRNLDERGVKNIQFMRSNLFSAVTDRTFDVVISNPPYISKRVKSELQIELSFEPDTALFGGEVGDEILIDIIKSFFKREDKYLICEMGYDQRESILSYIDGRGELSFYKDLAGLDRGFILKR